MPRIKRFSGLKVFFGNKAVFHNNYGKMKG